MKSALLVLVLFIACALALDPDESLAQAIATGGVVVAAFTARACSKCAAPLERVLHEVSSQLVQQTAADRTAPLRVVRLDIQLARASAYTHGVASVPTLVVVTSTASRRLAADLSDTDAVLGDISNLAAALGISVLFADRPVCGSTSTNEGVAGFGGHTDECAGHVLPSLETCMSILASSTYCDAATWSPRDQGCYLHRRGDDYWESNKASEDSDVHARGVLIKKGSSIDRCIEPRPRTVHESDFAG